MRLLPFLSLQHQNVGPLRSEEVSPAGNSGNKITLLNSVAALEAFMIRFHSMKYKINTQTKKINIKQSNTFQCDIKNVQSLITMYLSVLISVITSN